MIKSKHNIYSIILTIKMIDVKYLNKIIVTLSIIVATTMTLFKFQIKTQCSPYLAVTGKIYPLKQQF